MPSQWATATGQDIASVSAVPGYGVETYVDNWMNYFDRSSNGGGIFEGGQHDFTRNFAPPEARSFSLDATSSQFYPAASTAGTTATTSAAILPMPSMPLDPSLSEGHHQAAVQYAQHGASNIGGYPAELLGYDAAEIRSYIAGMDPKMMTTLENFDGLSARQQQQFLSLIRKRRSQSTDSSAVESGSLDLRYLDYQVLSTPSGKVTLSSTKPEMIRISHNASQNTADIDTLRTGFWP